MSPFEKANSMWRNFRRQQPHCRRNALMWPSMRMHCLMRSLACKSFQKGNHLKNGEKKKHHFIRNGAQCLPSFQTMTSNTLTSLNYHQLSCACQEAMHQLRECSLRWMMHGQHRIGSRLSNQCLLWEQMSVTASGGEVN